VIEWLLLPPPLIWLDASEGLDLGLCRDDRVDEVGIIET